MAGELAVQGVGTQPEAAASPGNVDATALDQAMRDHAAQQPEEASHWYDRPLGALQAVGGVGEMAVGGVLLAAPEPTMLTKAAGIAIGVHGADDIWTGVQTTWSGKPHQTVTEQAAAGGAQAMGASPQTAAMVGMTVDMAAGVANPEGRGSSVIHGAEALGDASRLTHDAASARHIEQVLQETAQATGNLTSVHRLTETEALNAGMRFLGPGYREIGKPGSGVFRSGDGLRQFRIDSNSLAGTHAPNVPHVHFETYATPASRFPVANNHVPVTP